MPEWAFAAGADIQEMAEQSYGQVGGVGGSSFSPPDFRPNFKYEYVNNEYLCAEDAY